MGWLSDKLFGKRKKLDLDKIRGYQQNTQGIIDNMGSNINEQISLSRAMMDPNSQQNQMMRGMMAQRASETGATVAGSMEKLGAMRNMSPAQVMMQSRMAQNQAMGGVNDKWQDMLQKRFGQGVGLMNNMIQAQSGMASQQQGLDENIANAYVQQVNAHNARRNKNMGMGMSLLGGVVGGFGGAGAGWSGAGFNSNMFG